jgi:hypothetical protein
MIASLGACGTSWYKARGKPRADRPNCIACPPEALLQGPSRPWTTPFVPSAGRAARAAYVVTLAAAHPLVLEAQVRTSRTSREAEARACCFDRAQGARCRGATIRNLLSVSSGVDSEGDHICTCTCNLEPRTTLGSVSGARGDWQIASGPPEACRIACGHIGPDHWLNGSGQLPRAEVRQPHAPEKGTKGTPPLAVALAPAV